MTTHEIAPQAPSAGSDKETVERIERVQSLAGGHYWRALADDGDDVEKGMVLLVLSVRLDQDGKPHTVILRPHPSRLSRKNYYTSELRYLVPEFLDLFEPAPDAQDVRQAEIGAAQAKVTELQTKLLQAQSSPLAMHEAITEAGLLPAPDDKASSAVAVVSTQTPGERSVLARAASGSLAQALEVAVTPERLEAMKAMASHEHAVAQARATYLKAATDEIAQAVTAIAPYYEEQAAAALASTEQVRDYVADLLQGIESLDLYVGTDVEVRTLRKGESAPVDEPLAVMQKKLYADMELCVYLPVDQWFDVDRLDDFFDALCRLPGLVDQVLPLPRCVVAMGATRRQIHYGHALTDDVMAQMNKETFLLVRDGENLHAVWSPVTSHKEAVSEHLFPTKDEHDRIFRGFDGQQITMSDVRYTDRLSQHEASALHYKRFLILAAGLDHRLGLFGRFYAETSNMSFVSAKFQAEHMRFIANDDDALALDGARPYPPLFEYLKKVNAHVGAGSRIAYDAYALMNPESAPSACRYAPRARNEMERQYKPVQPFGVAKVVKRGNDLQIKVEVSGETRNWEQRTFECAVSLRAYERSSWKEGLAYLSLDEITPQALRWYIHNRESRLDHLHFVQFFKEALAFVEAERLAQAPVREALRQALVEGRVGNSDGHEGIVDRAISTWRAANHGADVPAPGQKGWEALLRQMFSLSVARQVWSPQALEAFAQAQGMQPLAWRIDGNGADILYAAPLSGLDDRAEPFAWVRRLVLAAGKSGDIKIKRSTWVRVAEHSPKETSQHDWPELAQWTNRQSSFESPAHKEAVFDLIQRGRALLSQIGTGDASTVDLLLAQWVSQREGVNRKSRYVIEPDMLIPVGLSVGKRVQLVCVRPQHVGAMLARANPEVLDEARTQSCRLYRNKVSARERMEQALESVSPWRLCAALLPATKEIDEAGLVLWGEAMTLPGIQGSMSPPALEAQLAAARKKEPEKRFDVQAPEMLDVALGLSMPVDWAPSTVYQFSGDEEVYALAIVRMAQEEGLSFDAMCKLSSEMGLRASTTALRALETCASVAKAGEALASERANHHGQWVRVPDEKLQAAGIAAIEFWVRQKA